MARGRKKEIDENPASRNWKLLLYPDNPLHLRVMDEIEFRFPSDYLYIQHKNYDAEGNVIREGEGKLHCHYFLQTPKEIRRGSLCKVLSLVEPDTGLPDGRFLQKVYGRYQDFLLYMTHLPYPDKGQYTVDDLVGASRLLAEYDKAALDYLTKDISVRDAVRGCIDWIRSQDDVISCTKFAQWILDTPYFRVRNDRLVLSCLDEHNQKIRQAQIDLFRSRSEDPDLIAASYPAYQHRLAMASGGHEIWLGSHCYDESEIEDI